MSLSSFGIRRPLAVFMLFIGVVVLGFISFLNLKIDLFPEMNYPMMAVITNYSGVGPQEIESMVTEPIEKILATVTDVKNLQSKSLQEISVVMLEFEWETNMDSAANNVREKLDLIKNWLPEDMQNPIVVKFDPSMMPVMFLGLSGPNRGLDELRTLAEDKVGKRLERIDGVAVASVLGGLQREIQVRLHRSRLEGLGLSLNQVVAMIQAANLDLPGGHLKIADKDYVVRVTGKFINPEDMAHIVVENKRGVVIHLQDIADVKDDYQEITSFIRVNGEPGVLIQIQKASSSNTVQVAQKIRRELTKIQNELPAGVKISKIMDQAEFIEGSISNVEQSTLEGAILAIIVILIFLGNWRSTLIISLAIPISVITTFALLYFGNLTLNIATLGGLALGVGRLVDDAIVVLENIYRHMQAGERPREASLLGAIEVSKAVMAATFTTIIVFLPILFVTGMAGVIFKPMAYTVSFSLLASLLVALLLIPVLTSKFMRVTCSPSTLQDCRGWVEKFNLFFNRYYTALVQVYQRLLNLALNHRRRVILLVLGIFLGTLLLLPLVGMEFIPVSDEGEFSITFKMPIGTRLEKSILVLNRIQKIVDRLVPEVENSFSRVGVEGQGMGAMASIFGGISGSHAGILQARLVSRTKRQRTTDEIVELLRPELTAIPGAEIRFSQQHSMGLEAAPIEVEVQGHDLALASRLAQQIMAIMPKVKGTRDIQLSREEGLPEMQISINRLRAAQLGLTVAQVGSAIETAMAGKVVSIYRDPTKGKEYNIRVQYQLEDRSTLADLERIMLVSPLGEKIPVANVARVHMAEGPVAIDRKNQERIITISSQVSGRAPGDVAAEIQRRIRNEITVPDEFNIVVAGSYQNMLETFVNLLFALGLSVLLIYMVLVAQFESLLDPFIIMFTVPLGIIGVIWGLLITGNTLSAVSFLGIIMMAGIVVSNAILLVDYTNILRRRGLELREAVVTAGQTRLRPVLMTTLTTILGMLPMALGLGEGAEVEAPMAVAVIFGLGVSTILTLVVIPTLYTAFEERLKRRKSEKARLQASSLSAI